MRGPATQSHPSKQPKSLPTAWKARVEVCNSQTLRGPLQLPWPANHAVLSGPANHAVLSGCNRHRVGTASDRRASFLCARAAVYLACRSTEMLQQLLCVIHAPRVSPLAEFVCLTAACALVPWPHPLPGWMRVTKHNIPPQLQFHNDTSPSSHNTVIF